MKKRPGQPRTGDAGQLAATVRHRLKRIQYRPALISGFLAQTGLTLDPQPRRNDQMLTFQTL